MPDESLAVISIALAVLILLVYRPFSSVKLPLPPGPTPRFWSGNVHQLPTIMPWLTFTEWGKTYGPIFYFRIFSNKVIVLNSGEAALDLLESRSTIYSDRPITWMLGELAGRKMSAFLMPYHHPRFRKYRTFLHTGLNPRAAQTYRPIQEQETLIFLQGLAETPDSFVKHIRRNATGVILKVAYGYTVSTDNDSFVPIMEKAFHVQALVTTPGEWLVESFPILRFVPEYFPGARFKRVAKEVARELSRIDMVPFTWAKERIEEGNYIDSFISRYLRPEHGPKPSEEEEDIIKWCSAALYAGGADTTVSAMTSFFLLMSLYPDVQKRAQAEVDQVVGRDRLPTLDDQNALVYISALIKEVIRWGPVAPLGLRHRVTEDDVYQGYHIPKGATVIGNIWAITHDDDLYPNPSEFDPTRHLGDEPQTDPFKFVFGFGRRVCPGAHFAELSLFLNISNVLAMFNISKALDKDGQEIEPPISWFTGITAHLKPFGCRITPRSPETAAMLNA